MYELNETVCLLFSRYGQYNISLTIMFKKRILAKQIINETQKSNLNLITDYIIWHH